MTKGTTFCLDFGNTNYKLAIFQSGAIRELFTMKSVSCLDELKVLISKWKPTRSILSSVVSHDKAIEELLKEETSFHLLTENSKLPFLNAYTSPESLGHDRLAVTSALSKEFPAKNSLCITIGTCITYNFLNAQGTYRGGAISPGIHLRLKSLNEHTANLPLVAKEGYSELIGFDTESSIRSGVINGITAEISGMIASYELSFGKINAVLTGGDALFFARRLKKEIFADEHFTYKGLYAILEHQK